MLMVKDASLFFHRAIKAVLYHSRQREHLLQR